MSHAIESELSTAVPCHRCGYDVRAHPGDGKCPECGYAVGESRRLAAIPKRPAWRDSDPRWRRRMLAGAWVLVLLPLMTWLERNGWAKHVPLPQFLSEQTEQTLEESFLKYTYVHLMFCIGTVLLFTRERGRQPARLDRGRPWGVVGSWLVLGVGSIQMVFLTSLVTVGIAAMFNAMWPPARPGVTDWLVTVSTNLIWYGPHPSKTSDAAVAGISAVVMLLAAVPLLNALRSSGPRVVALILVSPLAVTAIWQLGEVVLFAVFGKEDGLMGFASVPTPGHIYRIAYFFQPRALVSDLNPHPWAWSPSLRDVGIESVKWFACLGIATWLSVAQIAALVRRR